MKHLLLKSDFVRNVLTLMTGTAISQLIPIAVTPILTRLYTPQEFGVFAVFSMMAGVISTFATGRYEIAIISSNETNERPALFKLAVILSAFTSLCVFVVLFLLDRYDVLDKVLQSQSWYYIYLLPINVFILGIYQSLVAYNTKEKKYRKISTGKVAQSFTSSLLGLILYAYGSLGLVFSSLLAQLISLKCLTIKASREVTFKSLVNVAEKYKKYPLFNIWSALLNKTSSLIPLPLLTLFYGGATAGNYSIAHRILFLPMSLIGSSVSQVYFQSIAEDRGDLKIIKQKTHKTIEKLIVVGIPFLVIAYFSSEKIFPIILGAEWLVAGIYAKYLSVWVFMVFISSPLSTTLLVLEKHKELLIFNIILFLTRVISVYIGYELFQSDMASIGFYSLSGVLVWLCLLVYIFITLGFSGYYLIKMVLFLIVVILMVVFGEYFLCS